MSRRSVCDPLCCLPILVILPVLLILGSLVAGCAASGPRPLAGAPATVAPGPEAAGAGDYFEERALLLLLADRQTYEPLVVRRSLLGPPALREDLAVALGRSGDSRGLDPLLGLLLDEDAVVRRAAAFALGELGERLPAGSAEERRRAAAKLLEAVSDPDRRVGALAVESLGKLGVTIGPVAARAEELGPEERWPRLLPALFRFPDPETPGLATDALAWIDREHPDGAEELRRRAVYALTRRPQPTALGAIRALLGGGAAPGEPGGLGEPAEPTAEPRLDPLEAAWAARALGRIGTGALDLELLRPLADRAEPEPVIAALGAARALVANGRAAARDTWRERLAELLEDPRPGVRMAAIDAASAWLLDPRLSPLLAKRVTGTAPAAERGEALIALATGADPRAEGLAAAAAGSAEARMRARAAEAAGVLGAAEILERLADDRSPAVRQAVLAARLAHAVDSEARVVALLRAALSDPDTALRTAALDRLSGQPLLPVGELGRAWERARGAAPGASAGGAEIEERLAVVAALVTRGTSVPEGSQERQEATALLLDIGTEAEHAVRVRAADGLAELGLTRPPAGAVDTGQGVAVYRRILLETGEPRTVEMRTVKGPVRIRLECPRAPLTCLNFLRLAAQGFYDGLELHRVVPGFVVQGGDPRGDGLGGPGYVIRDEINRLRFDRRGVVGMALAGPDTGGSQFFVTLAPQPHLDGGYTAFGEVVDGLEVLDQLVPGDRIEAIREVAGSRAPVPGRSPVDSGDW